MFLFYCTSAVGAGSAGCVLANRLSEDGDKTVLLLEAGVEELEMHMSNIPASAFELQRSQFDWSFMTVPQRHGCKGLENQVHCVYHNWQVSNNICLF